MKLRIEYVENTYNEEGNLIKSTTREEHRDTDKLLTFQEAGGKLNTTRQVVRGWCFKHLMPYELIDGNYFVRESAVQSFVKPRRGYKAKSKEAVAA